MRDVAAMQKMLASGDITYDKISSVVYFPNNNIGYAGVNQTNPFFRPTVRIPEFNSIASDRLYDTLKSELLVELLLKDTKEIDKLDFYGFQNDLEYVAMKSVITDEQKAIAIVNAISEFSPKFDCIIVNVLEFAIIAGKENIFNHILNGTFVLENDVLRRFVRFLVDNSRFDIVKRLVDENDEDKILDILEFDFWDKAIVYSQDISNAEATCRYLEVMLAKIYDKRQILQKINEVINHPFNMRFFVSNYQEFNDLSRHGVTITNATYLASASWDSFYESFNEEFFRDSIKPLLAEKLTLHLGVLFEYASGIWVCDREKVVPTLITKAIEQTGAQRLTIDLSDTYYSETDAPFENKLEFVQDNIVSSVNASAVKALLKVPSYHIDEEDTEYRFIRKLTINLPRYIVGLVKKGVITGKALEAVLDAAINAKNYEVLNQIRMAVHMVK